MRPLLPTWTKKTVFTINYRPDWSRAIVYKNIDHGNDVTFSEKLRGKLNINVIVKNKSTAIFQGLHSRP